MSVTMRQVAERAGVSIKTVSRVVNEQGEISEATRRHVLKTIKELGYRPNTLARSLVSGKTLTVALVVPALTDPMYPELVEGAEAVAQRHGYETFLRLTHGDAKSEWEAVECLADKRVDGILLGGSRLSEKKMARIVEGHGIPVVALTPLRPKNILTVQLSGAEGLHQTASHLLERGHTSVAYLGFRSPEEDDRMEGVQRALEEREQKLKKRRTVFAQEMTVEAGYEAAMRLMAESPEITALAAYDDHLAIGAMRACAESGRRVPEDVAVTGYGDLLSASLVTPSLTTVRVPRRMLGEWMMDQLLKALASEAAPVERIRVKPELLIRESSDRAVPSEKEE